MAALLFFSVPFDSSRTTYLFGEVTLAGNSVRAKVNVADSIATDSVIYAGPERGDNNELASVCRTESFIIPENANVSFFRLLVNDNYANAYRDNARAKYLGWHITDTTIFRIFLVRDSDGFVIQTLDSIGTLPRLSYAAGDTRFGTDPKHIFQTIAVASGFAGTRAHLEILPAWYGYDDFTNEGCDCCPVDGPRGIIFAGHGMSAKNLYYGMNYSAMLDSAGIFALTPELNSSWSTQKYNQLVAYEDSVIAATGCMELPLPLGFDSSAQTERFNMHYGGVPETLSTGHTYWKSIHCQNHSPSFATTTSSRSQSTPRYSIAGIRLIPNLTFLLVAQSSDSKNLHIEVESSQPVTNATATLVAVSGRRVGRALHCDINKGKTSLDLALPGSASDAYFLIIMDSASNIVGTYRVALEK